MSVKPIIPSIENNNAKKIRVNKNSSSNVSFGGTNIVVDSMNFIEKGGYAAAFCIQDGLGFIIPRVGGGLLRGKSPKLDEEGKPILDSNGKPEMEYNWALARKEFLREIITGPSAFVIPWIALKGINKIGSGNNVKLNYLDGFNEAFTNYAKDNLDKIKSGNAPKTPFYQNVYESVITESINGNLPEAEKLSAENIKTLAQQFAERQVTIEGIKADSSLDKKVKKAKLADLESVESLFMKLRKGHIGGVANESAVSIKSSDGVIRSGSIGELTKAMKDYFGDAVNNTRKALVKNADSDISEVIKNFTHTRMGSRVFTNLGLFGLVAAFYTQIPKLYNAGLKSNPALKGTAADTTNQQSVKTTDKNPSETNGKDVAFTGLGNFMSKTGEKIFSSKTAKSISDIFEFNGPEISGMAMPVLLYGFCIPPRLQKAQDKYDFGEIVLRDVTSFTALLFGAKALARGFSDGFTKLTGLALNRKTTEHRNLFQKTIDYLNPRNTNHAVLSSDELTLKYTNLEDYKGRVNGFIEFIEKSGGDIKKTLSHDDHVKISVDNILKEFNGKTFKQATSAEIKEALKMADQNSSPLINNFYKLFKSENGILKLAKTCNSSFTFLSTFMLVPSLIIWLTHACKKMTERRTAEDLQNKNAQLQQQEQTQVQKSEQIPKVVATSAPTMAGFLKK